MSSRARNEKRTARERLNTLEVALVDGALKIVCQSWARGGRTSLKRNDAFGRAACVATSTVTSTTWDEEIWLAEHRWVYKGCDPGVPK
jgi:hypothetical protein